MIEPAKRQRVRELLATGEYSQREIAEDCGVARATVQRIQAGCGCQCAEPCDSCECSEVDPLAHFVQTLAPDQLLRYQTVRAARIAREEARRAS